MSTKSIQKTSIVYNINLVYAYEITKLSFNVREINIIPHKIIGVERS